jgi:hypothetical protein
MHAGSTGVNEPGMRFDEVSYLNRSSKADITHISGHAIVPAPTYRAGITSLVDPLENFSCMDYTAIRDIRGIGEEPQSDSRCSGIH